MELFDVQLTQPTLSHALTCRDEAIWREFSNISLARVTNHFLDLLSGNTKRAYQSAFREIFKLFIDNELFDPNGTLQTFALSNLEFLLDEIKRKLPGSEATKQARAAAFISLTRYLQRMTGGLIRKVTPKKEKINPTFRPIRETSSTQAMTRSQWMRFLICLKKISTRDYLMAKMMLQGAKRVSEVIGANIEQICWEKKQISFRQLKCGNLEKFTIITYPESFLKELKDYLGARTSGLIFITRDGGPLTQSHLYRAFTAAGIKAAVPFHVHPHVLRASAITYLSSQGYSVEQIMRVSGHADAKLVRYYDKMPLEQNPTAEVSLI
ncbi:MAG: site-specific integrase [Parachlamydia sp.]|nr:site-specific integrase [Parachlamydia sp.]